MQEERMIRPSKRILCCQKQIARTGFQTLIKSASFKYRIFIYIYMYVCVCMYVCLRIFSVRRVDRGRTKRCSILGETQVWLDGLELTKLLFGIGIGNAWWNDDVLTWLPVDWCHNTLGVTLLQGIDNS